jgi:hypothetical protein
MHDNMSFFPRASQQEFDEPKGPYTSETAAIERICERAAFDERERKKERLTSVRCILRSTLCPTLLTNESLNDYILRY